jgi:hypothetical protein
MKKARTKPECSPDEQGDDVAAEYDFSKMKGGVRGKYSKAYREGHTVSVCKEDGTVEVKYFQLEDGAVLLEPDIRQYFPDSEAVNRALRALIAIAPKKKGSTHSKA